MHYIVTSNGVDGLKILQQLWSNVDEKINNLILVYTCSKA